MTQKAFIGDTVHYRSYGTPGGEYLPECRAAIIVGIPKRTRAANSRGEDLFVMTPTGEHHNRCLQDEDTKAGGTWHWPEPVEDEPVPVKKATAKKVPIAELD
jgi:hypothetical protein